MPLNTTFDAQNNDSFSKFFLNVNWQSVQALVTAGNSQNIDFLLTEDMMLDGLQLIAEGSNFGDTASLQIVCISGTLANGVTICPPNTLLNQFGTNIGMSSDQQVKVDVSAAFPAKLLGGMTIRCVYTSTGLSPVNVIINYKLLTVLS